MELKKRIEWRVDERKFLSAKEVKKLRRIMLKEKDKARERKKRTRVRDWFLLELGINTGLRVNEMVNLRCSDFVTDSDRYFVIVRNGKCGKSRAVRFNKRFKREIDEFIEWKKEIGEAIGDDDPVFFSVKRNEKMTRRCLQIAFKRCLINAKIPESKYSIHCLRHTYASHLFKASRYNLRLVQRQLGHSSMKITEVYAQVLDPDIDKAVERLFRN